MGYTLLILNWKRFNQQTLNRYNYNSQNTKYYIGALEYVSNQMLSAIERIIDEDPNSVIIWCSDHSNRFGIKSVNTTTILNTLYYKGEKIEEFEGLSGVNTLRLISNKLLNTNMGYIELPNN